MLRLTENPPVPAIIPRIVPVQLAQPGSTGDDCAFDDNPQKTARFFDGDQVHKILTRADFPA